MLERTAFVEQEADAHVAHVAAPQLHPRQPVRRMLYQRFHRCVRDLRTTGHAHRFKVVGMQGQV
jgi:hypothetical protein